MMDKIINIAVTTAFALVGAAGVVAVIEVIAIGAPKVAEYSLLWAIAFVAGIVGIAVLAIAIVTHILTQ